MGESCHNCRPWAEDIYWNHFQFVHFAQLLPRGFDQQLEIPRSFSDNLRKKLPEYVILKGPGGAEWSIGLTMRDDSWQFTHGWQQFVKDHCLEENDLLVFKYNNESQFDVLIFDRQSFCEKTASYFVRKCGHANKRNRYNCMEEVNIPSNFGVECASPEKPEHDDSFRVPAAAPSETSGKKNCNAGLEFVSPVSAVPAVVMDVQSKRSGRPKRSNAAKASNAHGTVVNWITDAEPLSASAGRNKMNETLYISNRRPVAEDEKNKALQMAQAVCTIDDFYIVMRPSHVYKRFYASIPSKWITEHLSAKSEDVILRMEENEWPAKFSYEHVRRTGGLTGGWKHFALDNNLEEFDVCVFKLADKTHKPLLMDVIIFRVIEECTPLAKMNSVRKRGKKAIQA